MSKSGPEGTRRQRPPPLPSGGKPSSPGTQVNRQGSGTDVHPPDAAGVRDDEYVDHAVHKLRANPSGAVTSDRKIVIASREARTVRIDHQELPALKAAIARERAARSKLAQEELATQVGTAWVEDPESFVDDTFPSFGAVPSVKFERPAERGARLWTLLLVLLFVLVGAAGTLWFLNGMPSLQEIRQQLSAYQL